MLYQIYLVINKINGKKYVGQTSKQVGYKNRFLIHCKCIENPGSCIFHKALKKYGVNNFELVLVEDNIPEELVDNKEKEYIMKYNTFFKNNLGYNMTLGGQGVHGYSHTDETKKKLSEKLHQTWIDMKINNPDEYKKQCKIRSDNLKGKLFSEEHKQHIKDSIQRNKDNGTYVNAFKGRKHSEETIEKIRETRKKRPLIALDIKTNEPIKSFASVHEAQRYLIEIGSIPQNNSSACTRICIVCGGGGKTAYGFKWKWLENK